MRRILKATCETATRAVGFTRVSASVVLSLSPPLSLSSRLTRSSDVIRHDATERNSSLCIGKRDVRCSVTFVMTEETRKDVRVWCDGW